jgi:hypothetical protein
MRKQTTISEGPAGKKVKANFNDKPFEFGA